MSAWDSFGTTYVESITNTLPLHRLILFTVGFFGSLSITSQTHSGVTETIISWKLSELTALESGVLKDAALLNVIVGLSAVLIGLMVSRAIIWATFSTAAELCDLDVRTNTAVQRSNKIISMTPEQKRQEIAILETSLDKQRFRLKTMNSLSEIFGGVAVYGLVSYVWGDAIDLTIGVVSLVACVVMSIMSMRTFFSDYYGVALFVTQLQGRRPPTPP